ncbi:hypothetical protein ACM26W_14850 [Halomonas sp. HK25]|uniref:hypothetical protein n=1 Tax=Halomonas sp. HK25 TaxID=3394321 RepID=UPI0039FC7CB1
MSLETRSSSLHVQQLLERGYVSIGQQRPEQALNPIDAALLMEAGPGISSVFWRRRHHDLVLGAQESATAREPAWD